MAFYKQSQLEALKNCSFESPAQVASGMQSTRKIARFKDAHVQGEQTPQESFAPLSLHFFNGH